MHLAVSHIIFEGFLSEEIGQRVIRKKKLRLIVFDPETEGIVEWIT
ncbi:MAG: element excision factor XisH family protein [Cyanobacteriota bacterium]|nr:element excision factor XisH family protein [Cyanobacteriota bacterium]